MTRPEPTLYGNCESWSFIVGKKPEMAFFQHLLLPALASCKFCISLSH